MSSNKKMSRNLPLELIRIDAIIPYRSHFSKPCGRMSVLMTPSTETPIRSRKIFNGYLNDLSIADLEFSTYRSIGLTEVGDTLDRASKAVSSL